MKTKRNRAMKLCRFIAIAVSSLVTAMAVAATENLTESFRKALAGVDRIVVERSGFSYPGESPVKPARLLEINGVDQVASLGQVVEVERRTPHCLCITSPEIRFYAGEHLRFSLTVHHSIYLRDADGPWLGDVKLTDASAAAFHEWFAQRGYPGFVEGHKAMLQYRREHEENRARFLAMFPANGKGLPADGEYPGPKETQRWIEEHRAAKPNPTERIILGWRGLGVLADSRVEDSPPGSFLVRVLGHEATGDLQAALVALPEADADAWRGAYVHYRETRGERETARIQEAVDDEWLARLVRRNLTDHPQGSSWEAISLLERRDGPHVRTLLYELAATDRWETTRPGKKPQRDFRALVALAEFKDPRAAEIAAAKLADKSLGESERLTLDIICAAGGNGPKIGPEHLAGALRDAEPLAWTLLKEEAQHWPTDTLLAEMRKDGSYAVEKEIRSLLVKRGVQAMSKNEQLKYWWTQEYAYTRRMDTLEETRKAMAEVLALPADPALPGKQEFFLEKLRAHEGRYLNALGRYEEARSSLIQADYEMAAEEMVIACLATGRTEEAWRHARIDSADSANAADSADAAQWRRRGFVHWASGDFADAAQDFEVAARMDYVEENAVLFAHLALVLAGDEPRSRLAAWRNPFDAWVLEDEDGNVTYHWPETGILHLQGKMTWDELLTSAGKAWGEKQAEAYFALSVLCRIKNDRPGETAHLRSALATKEYRAYGYLLALIRSRELGLAND